MILTFLIELFKILGFIILCLFAIIFISLLLIIGFWVIVSLIKGIIEKWN